MGKCIWEIVIIENANGNVHTSFVLRTKLKNSIVEEERDSSSSGDQEEEFDFDEEDEVMEVVVEQSDVEDDDDEDDDDDDVVLGGQRRQDIQGRRFSQSSDESESTVADVGMYLINQNQTHLFYLMLCKKRTTVLP